MKKHKKWINAMVERYNLQDMEKKELKNFIAELSDNNEVFENCVFEIGMHYMVKQICKQKCKDIF